MKYIVEVKYTNPSHEHVSLRRRVDTITRVVEARNPQEAVNRAANQQRSLGFKIESANIVQQKVEELKPEVISEEINQIEESEKDWKRAFGSVATKNLNKDVGSMRSNVSRLKYVGMQPKVDITQKVTAKEVKRNPLHAEEIDPDKRDAGYKMSPAVRAAQKKSDELSKREKRPQAGTLAAAKKSGKVVPQKTDADVKVNVAEETVSERVVNKKVVRDVATPGQQKKVKAAKIAIGAARNKINLKPMV